MPFDSPEGLLADGTYVVGTPYGTATFANLQVSISRIYFNQTLNKFHFILLLLLIKQIGVVTIIIILQSVFTF